MKIQPWNIALLLIVLAAVGHGPSFVGDGYFWGFAVLVAGLAAAVTWFSRKRA